MRERGKETGRTQINGERLRDKLTLKGKGEGRKSEKDRHEQKNEKGERKRDIDRWQLYKKVFDS